MHLIVRFTLPALAALLAACGPVHIRPEKALPRALVQPLAADAGLVLGSDLTSYIHKETRAGTDWDVGLGGGHVRLLTEMLRNEFRRVEVFQTLDAARAGVNLAVIFEPFIEQYSFATANDTGGRYWAVTIRYRFNVFTPTGEQADSLTLSGYGSAPAGGGKGKALEAATVAAMRDAASKFLVQFPRQPVGTQIAKGETLKASTKVAAAATSDPIETVPIEETAELKPPAPATPAPKPAGAPLAAR